ncbi:hydroxyquinol 1,2-dioxygenase [Novosphingobium sp. Rr 2-17]|uniref:intradiol ring-cleavage dioxygenase n=1 Tax=Novosphingobium sp. Rr 2-17 TaxID=555793 RepID=UPI0002697EDF|nr:intradiol ring-cleavage dioxygenase [Novosphingobium sp. Rr 2-17]EIZ78356.1 hydroxyquinol 1,2-dioxygenase [Novosphingobium sp. Rr 2-17]
MVPDYDESNITAAVLGSLTNAKSERARHISEAMVRHLHAFIREIEPTEAEWMAGIDFLTRTGQMCSQSRQEFILLSDTLGASMLVDAINHRLPSGATATTVLGPFYTPPPEFGDGDDMSNELEGAPLFIEGSVASVSGERLAGALVDIWHCDSEGFYDLQQPTGIDVLSGRGRFRTQADGSFHLWTVRPTAYPIPADGPVGEMLAVQGRHPFRPEHVHFRVEAPGHHELVTHLFARGDDWLLSDVVFGVKDALIRSFEQHEGGIARDGRVMDGTWFTLRADFGLAPATK